MTLRRLASLILPPIVVAAGRRLAGTLRGEALPVGGEFTGIPWTPGYFAHRADLVARTLADAALMERFRHGRPLPPRHGVGIDERAVEYAWALSRLGSTSEDERLLDAGSALNHPFLVEQPQLASRKLDIVTLAPEAHCFWKRGISYLFADLRDLPQRDGWYDAVISISTVEHVGYDNSIFGSQAGGDGDDDLAVAMSEMWRVLRPGGRLFVTVPYGRRRRFPSFEVYDAERLADLEACLPGADVQRTFFRYAADGWNVATAETCADADYVPWIMSPDHRGAFPRQDDRATAARAVACLDLTKARGCP